MLTIVPISPALDHCYRGWPIANHPAGWRSANVFVSQATHCPIIPVPPPQTEESGLTLVLPAIQQPNSNQLWPSHANAMSVSIPVQMSRVPSFAPWTMWPLCSSRRAPGHATVNVQMPCTCSHPCEICIWLYAISELQPRGSGSTVEGCAPESVRTARGSSACSVAGRAARRPPPPSWAAGLRSAPVRWPDVWECQCLHAFRPHRPAPAMHLVLQVAACVPRTQPSGWVTYV